MTELVLLGGGRMGEALLAGWLSSGRLTTESVTVVESSADRRAELVERYAVRVVASADDIGRSDAGAADATAGRPTNAERDAVLAVKPQQTAAVAAQVAPMCRRIVSIAAGITTAALEEAAPDTAVIRVMPNTPALVGAGMSAVCGGSRATADDVAWAVGLLAVVGDVVEVAESQMDAVTGVSGSGPAYLFLVAEALRDAGVRAGLARPLAERLAAQTILGAGTMLAERPGAADELRGAVTSPGGTTAEALSVLERGGVRAAFIDAVDAAVRRAGELA